jgi:hypothetical protein
MRSARQYLVVASAACGKEGTAVEHLEFGQLLMSKRGPLTALAASLTGDAEQAGVAVRCTLCEAWWVRSQIVSEAELDSHLFAVLRERISSDLRRCRQRALTCPRAQYYSLIGS